MSASENVVSIPQYRLGLFQQEARACSPACGVGGLNPTIQIRSFPTFFLSLDLW